MREGMTYVARWGQPGDILSVKTEGFGVGVERVAGATAVMGRERAAQAVGRGPEHGPADSAGDRVRKAVRPRTRRKFVRWARSPSN